METKEVTFRQDDWKSVALPVVLMLTGAVLLGGDYLGVLSLDRIQNFWPLVLVVIGLTELTSQSTPSRG
jgi:hypothetical protein